MAGKQSVSDRIRHRTIMDMLQDDDQASGSKKSWKAFRDKLRLKKAGAAWTSTVPIPASDIPIQTTNTNRMMMRRGSARYPSDPNADSMDGDGTRQLGHMDRQRSVRLLPVETDPESENENNSDDEKPAAEEDEQQKSQTSLMSLLEEDYGSHDVVEDEGEHDAEPVEEAAAAAAVEEDEGDIGDCNICCGCRGKHKGAAFGPCGHTFCRNCTKEFHVSRGNCPTCNNYILEILDIY